MVMITVWITVLMCAVGAVALYIVKGNSVKSKKAETVKNKFSIILDAGFEPFKYGVCFNNCLIAVCCTKEEAIEYINKVKKNCEGVKPDGAVYEEYVS